MRTRCPHIIYSAAELAWLEANKTMVISDYHAAFVAAFGRDDVTAAHLHGLRKRKGWRTGRTGHFEAGQSPWTKGRKLPFNPFSAATQFKKGQRPPNAQPIGYEHLRSDGYVEMLVDKTNPYTGAARRFVLKHKFLWEQANGPLPAGHCLKCLDGNKLNTDPKNWEAIPRAMLPRLNGRFGRDYDNAAAELKPVILTTAKLEHLARERRKSGEAS